MKCVYSFLLLSLIVQGCLSTINSVDANENMSESQLTGQGLIELGIKLDKPLLKFIGQTMRRVENRMDKEHDDVVEEMCRLHPCSEWSEWSECDATNPGEFGGQTRGRTCGLNTTYCKHNTKPTFVTDRKVCQLLCPKDYTFTNNNFCLKLYDKLLARDDAENICQNDGGHLVNVDSGMKVKYVNETILQQSFSSDMLWIDGRKSVQGAPWTYGYKSTDPSFTFWGDNDPDNGPTELCIVYHRTLSTKQIWQWFDTPCTHKRAFICEYQYE
ncbi:uncharacterized protein LOC132750252 [Ruditapes philippinarum]|uniref:uncharacterized protein LOC132750252 n=1 Tax=Ruditapes philippinarum TaxID=129788 RepID=UPI00295AFEF1|nr:uncharacterized protein LOC132750252 [Ruditapes philippinarum]